MKKHAGDKIVYCSQTRLALVVKVITALLSAILLMVPVYLIFSLNLSTKWLVITVTLAVLVFAFASSVLTKARTEDIFVATSVYCAFLILLIGTLRDSRA